MPLNWALMDHSSLSACVETKHAGRYLYTLHQLMHEPVYTKFDFEFICDKLSVISTILWLINNFVLINTHISNFLP